MARFNPPPGWPPAPHGWRPPAGWRPDPSWPPPPPGWPLWVDDAPDAAAPVRRSRVLPVLAGVVAAVVLLGGGGLLAANLFDPPPVPVPPGPDPVPPGPDPVPPGPDPDPPTPVPPVDGVDLSGVTATQFGLGTLTVGDDVATVERTLGISLPVIWSDDECVVRLDEQVGVGTVDVGGAVQTYVVLRDDVRTPEDLGTGSTRAEIEAAYPQWVGGMSDYETVYGGEFVTVLPSTYGTSPDTSSSARHLLFELDAAGVVQRYRVGAPPYVTHVDICSTPD